MLNSVVLIGRLTRDPELRYTPNGIAVSTFTLAVNRNFTNKQGQREADFINIVSWRNTAEIVAKYLTKGSLIAVEGRIQTRNYENKEGRRIYVTEVVADDVRFLETRRDRGETDDAVQQMGGSTAQQMSGGRSVDTDDPFANADGPINISDDDLPF